MRITRFHLLLIMIFCAAVIAIVAVVSLYVPGSHDWEFDSGTEKCGECHDEIKAEIESMPAGSPHLANYNAEGCSFCHVNYTIGVGVGNHSGLLPECQDCHPITEPERDGDSEYGTLNFTSQWEAHKPMYDNLTGSDHDPGKNKACMACHTRVDVVVQFNRPEWYNFTIGSDWNVTQVDVGPQFVGGNYTIQYLTSDLGKHFFVPYRNCSSVEGCHQDVDYSRTAGGSAYGYSGGHQSNISAAHPNSVNCTYCHWGEDPTKDFHAARRINCTYSGCHSPVSSNMTTLFTNIDSWVQNNSKGDLCWGCHSGFDWIDAGTGLKLQVQTERNYNVSWWTGFAWQQVYPDPNINCSSCHNDSLPNVPPIPIGSSKYVDHDTTGNYSFGADGSSGCLNCHDENWAPHDNPHDIQITYIDYRSSISNSFCNTSCHYSVIDSRPGYADQTTSWMEDIATSFDTANSLHETSTLINSTGSVQCWDCHPEHEFMPDDGGLSVPGCGATNLNVSCHVPDKGWGNKTDTPSSHGANWVAAGRDNCIESGCHDKHNYTLDPTEGHNPKPQSCHGTGGDGGCDPNTNSHPIHIDSTNNPSYNFDCGECHWDTVSNPSEADGTFGTVMHNNGTVDVNFDNTTNGIATYGGTLWGSNAPTYEGGNGSCSGTYCHSNAFNVSSGVGFISYESPDWSSGDIYCGDCHGIPNYYNGTAWRELGGNVTGNSPTHLKHTRNFGGINASRNLVWFDGIGGTHSFPDSDEAILQDDGDFLLDPGLLNATPDVLLVEGDAALTDFVVGDDVFWNDGNSNGHWDSGEDIWYDLNGNGNSFDPPEDWRLYNGGSNDGGIGGDSNIAIETGQSIMYLDSDRDDGYYSYLWPPGGSWPDTNYYSGTEEPLIYVGESNPSTGSNLLTTYEVLTPFQGDATYPSIGYWFDDMQSWYSFNCSECHYNNPPIAGRGTYGTSQHVDMNRQVFASANPAGISTYFGTYTPQYFSSTMECGVVYCHSDGLFYDGTDNNPDFAGPQANHSEDDTGYHETYPDWDDPTTVTCGSAGTSCHFAGDEDSTLPDTEHPNTDVHRRGGHVDADQEGWKGDAYDTWCFECHYDEDNGPYYYYHPYGMPTHVDGSVLIDSAARPWFNPISGDGRGDPCHDNGGTATWRGPYPGTGC